MLRCGPPVFFYLLPQNKAATGIVSLPSNSSFRHTDPSDGSVWLRIGINHTPKTSGRLVSIGHDPSCCDILLPEGYPQKQCHFYIHPRTLEIILRDDTSDYSTILISSPTPSETKYNLPDAQPRQRVVIEAVKNAHIKLQRALFRIGWSGTRKDALEAAQATSKFSPSVALGSHVADSLELGRIVHRRIRRLGTGSFAKVFLTVNLKTGDHLAVKIFEFEPEVEQEGKKLVRQEVDLIKDLSHPNIATFKHAQGWEPLAKPEIFMEAYQGSLLELLLDWKGKKGNLKRPPFFTNLTKQMLSALVYLHSRDIVHRDIKPDNILHDGKGNFYLADFGLSKRLDMSTSAVGSLLFVSPDIFQPGLQTTKMDVWGIGIVVLVCLEGMPRKRDLSWRELGRDHLTWFQAIRDAVTDRVPQLLPMFEIYPHKRCSAKDCLEKLFDQESKIEAMFRKPAPRQLSGGQRIWTEELRAQLGTGTNMAFPESASAARQAPHEKSRVQPSSHQVPPSTGTEKRPTYRAKSGHLAYLAEVTDRYRLRQQIERPLLQPQQEDKQPRDQSSRDPQVQKDISSQLRIVQLAQPHEKHPGETIARCGPPPRLGSFRSAETHSEDPGEKIACSGMPSRLGSFRLVPRQDQRPDVIPTRQGQLPNSTVSKVEELVAMRKGEIYRNESQQANQLALEQGQQRPASQLALSELEPLTKMRDTGQAHREPNQQAVKRAVQEQEAQSQSQLQTGQAVCGIPAGQQAQQRPQQPVRGLLSRELDRSRQDQLLRGLPAQRQAQQQHQQPVRGMLARDLDQYREPDLPRGIPAHRQAQQNQQRSLGLSQGTPEGISSTSPAAPRTPSQKDQTSFREGQGNAHIEAQASPANPQVPTRRRQAQV